MFSIKDAADYIASLEVVDQNHIWIGKLPDKKDKSIGIYPLKRNGPPRIPVGGLQNTDYDTKRISILIHWNKDIVETEQVSDDFYNKIRDTKGATINEQTIKFIQMLVPEAISVGTDENGIYEFVIEAEIYYERKGDINARRN